MHPNEKGMVALLKLSHVPRWSIVDMTKTQSVADHSFRVAAIVLHLANEIEELTEGDIKFDKGKLALAALVHDQDESESGDIPSTYKISNGTSLHCFDVEDGPIDEDCEYELILKMADLIEAVVFMKRYGVRPGKRKNQIESRLHRIIEITSKSLDLNFYKLKGMVDHIVEIGDNYA